MDMIISFWPGMAFRRFFALGAARPAGNAPLQSIHESTTFSPFGRGLGPVVLPLRLALMSSVRADEPGAHHRARAIGQRPHENTATLSLRGYIKVSKDELANIAMESTRTTIGRLVRCRHLPCSSS